MYVPKTAHIPFLSAREDYFDFFDGLASAVPKNLDKRSLPAGLQKSYLLETVGGEQPSLSAIIARSGYRCETVSEDKAVHRLVDEHGNGLAVLESFSGRYLALYTLLPSASSDNFVRKMVASNPLLDHLWISSESFMSLWSHVREVNSGRRYGKITFEHESVFESAGDAKDELNFENERRASRFTMVDRLDTIAAQLGPLSSSYAPLASVTNLRIPSPAGGGHELYYDGKVTNRSGSFLDHRSALLHVVDLYANLTQKVEESLWVAGQATSQDGLLLNGAVAELVFNEPLADEVFKRWMINLFNNRRNRFRISGYATWLSARKVHANAIDQHLWQPLLLEITPERLIAVLPEGTCGNTINRLVSNVQRMVDPRVVAYVGDVEYASLLPGAGKLAGIG
ncbi:hypothetical protein ABZ215_04385 [Amycolatopsis sp. NPDC006131]|uniref:hypothetical protein n=1 Tax=Amycolatopsis sp. NPDC006131 TaxID=3156731 RepID=UPI0033AAF497